MWLPVLGGQANIATANTTVVGLQAVLSESPVGIKEMAQ